MGIVDWFTNDMNTEDPPSTATLKSICGSFFSIKFFPLILFILEIMLIFAADNYRPASG